MASTPSSVVGQRNCIFVTAHSIGHGAGAQTMVSERGGVQSGLELSGFGWGMVSQESSASDSAIRLEKFEISYSEGKTWRLAEGKTILEAKLFN